MPMPSPINSHCARCSGVACKRRGNHCKGVDISRPSARTTCNASSVKETSIARASILSAKMLIPAPFDSRPVLFDQPRDLVQFIATEIAGPRKLEWTHPILCISPTLRNMNMHWLALIEAEEEETKS